MNATMRPWQVVVFGLVCALQLAVPASMVVRHELALRGGTRHLFECVSRDPVDAFRGRYLTLNIDAFTAEAERQQEDLEPGQTVFGVLARGEDGYTRIAELRLARPEDREYLTLRTGRWSRLDLPFDRYYLTESIAPVVDDIFRDDLREGRVEAALAVRVRGGVATTEELYLNGLPLRQYLEKSPPRQNDARP